MAQEMVRARELMTRVLGLDGDDVASRGPLVLLVRLTLYYAAVTGAVGLAVAIVPDLVNFLPIGGARELIRQPGGADPFELYEVDVAAVASLWESILWLALTILGALVTAIPVSWTYVEIRDRHRLDQSLVETIIILPVVVTGVVVVVQHSLALAFGLTGIVAGVRFRNTLKSSGDALFIFLVIGIGLACGVGATEIAIVVSIAFNYCFVVLWRLDYGARGEANRFLNRPLEENGEAEDPAAAPPPRRKKKAEGKGRAP